MVNCSQCLICIQASKKNSFWGKIFKCIILFCTNLVPDLEVPDDTCADIYSYGQVVAYLLTGERPWPGRNSLSVQGIRENLIEKEYVVIPEDLKGELRDIIQECREDDPCKRPSADTLVSKYFSSKYANFVIHIFSPKWSLYTKWHLLPKWSLYSVPTHKISTPASETISIWAVTPVPKWFPYRRWHQLPK